MEAALVENEISYTSKQKSWFFGVFALKPDAFYIPSGDLKLITKAIAQVNEIIRNNNNGIDRFSKNFFLGEIKDRIAYEQNMCDSVFGLVFGDTREIQNKQKESVLEEHRTKLFTRAKQIFQNHESDEILQIRAFTLDLVNVKFADNGQVVGTVGCSFCGENSPMANVKLYYRQLGRGSWIISNLQTHLMTHHSNIDDLLNIKKRIKKKPNHAILTNTSTEPNQIEPIIGKSNMQRMDSSVEDYLYQQMKRQIIKMGNCVTKNLEPHYEIVFGQKSWKAIKLCDVPAEGDCLFLSYAHQIYGYKIDSNDLNEKASELRTQVVGHILDNINDFVHEVKGRIYESGAVNIVSLIEDCRDFVENSLAQEGFWGGTESIKALSRMHDVNVIVINDDGSCDLPTHKLNLESKSTILIYFSGPKDVNCQNSDRNHYESVFWLPDVMLAEFAKQIAKDENQFTQFQNNCSAISIE